MLLRYFSLKSLHLSAVLFYAFSLSCMLSVVVQSCGTFFVKVTTFIFSLFLHYSRLSEEILAQPSVKGLDKMLSLSTKISNL